MINYLLRIFRRKQKKISNLNPDEIFLDAHNLPGFDTQQFEGFIEKAISKKVIILLGLFFLSIGLVFSIKLGQLQLIRGEEYRNRADQNILEVVVLLPERGVIYDRNGVELAWNSPDRQYIDKSGFGHLLGFVGYPTSREIEFENYYHKELIGKEGIEENLNNYLGGVHGLKITELDVYGVVQSEGIINESVNGGSVTLSIDNDIQAELFRIIKQLAIDKGYTGGSGIIMDVGSGEIIAITNYPEYNPNILSGDTDPNKILSYRNDNRKPFLNRAIQGLYTPGSIIKIFIAAGALQEKIIDPDKKILSTGSISVPHPYIPETYSVFKDWKAHGYVDMKEAISNSSNVYFYEIGGGFEDQKGLGIVNIEKYMRLFGFGSDTGSFFSGEGIGVIPTPSWKEDIFNGEPWRIGDTYNTAIGQYGFQVTPIQVVRAVAGLSNGGYLPIPTLVLGDTKKSSNNVAKKIDEDNLKIVREGMRLSVLEGTASGLFMNSVKVAAKTGTAELDSKKEKVNSWVTGFFPYENPRYSFVVVMEEGPRDNTIGGVFVMRGIIEWMLKNTPEYLITSI